MKRKSPWKGRCPRWGLVAALLATALAGGARTAAPSDAPSPKFAMTYAELVFENGRPDITVPKNYPGLAVYASLAFQGGGMLNAYWVVDGRILASVAEVVPVDGGLQLSTPSQPPLPTFEPGLHRVTLQVQTPPGLARMPAVTYFVTANEYAPPSR